MKYKVTPRGWVVFSIVGLLLLYGIFVSVRWMFFEDSPDPANQLEKSNIENEITDDIKDENDDEDVDGDLPDGIEDDSSEDQEDITSESDGDESENEEDSDETDGSENDNVPDEDNDKVVIPLEEKTIIYFEKNIANFTDQHKAVLQKWIEWLKAEPSLEIIVEGHINGFPFYDDGTFGLSIAEKRAEAVKDYIVNQGIDESRILIKNMGSTDQAVLTDDFSKHYLNRRAIIYFNN